MNQCAKLEPDPGSPSHRGFTPGAACPPGTRAPTRRGSGTGTGPPKPHLHRAFPRGSSTQPARRQDLSPRLPSGTRARRVASGKCRPSCATLHPAPRPASCPQRRPPCSRPGTPGPAHKQQAQPPPINSAVSAAGPAQSRGGAFAHSAPPPAL